MTILIPEDEPIFRRVLNLCNNAAQAMEGEGGSLGINLKNVKGVAS